MKKVIVAILVVLVIIVAVILVSKHYAAAPAAVPAMAPAATPMAQTATTAPTSQYVEGNLLLGTDSTSTLGSYLIGYNGMTLYTYTPDGQNVSNCTGGCAAAWPPYTVPSSNDLQNLQAGITGTVGSLTRGDSGALQVTYNGHPLYFFKNDTSPGDITGQGVGGVWYVAKP
jgi:predicted lipoprotein with Yx(FWY)xxD motif